jgi:hypothetical protein
MVLCSKETNQAGKCIPAGDANVMISLAGIRSLSWKGGFDESCRD